MFLPNNFGVLTRYGGTDKYGSPLYTAAPIKVPCGVVSLNIEVAKTAIRTEASASRGAADEAVSVATILFPSTVAIGEQDKFFIAGNYLRVKAVQPRFSVGGDLDHYQCDFEEWEP